MTEFLSVADVIDIHRDQIEHYGGDAAIRDMTLLSSAVMAVQSTFDGAYLHDDIIDMAAAYAFHICQNHPFVDGNKRTALASALVFLDINGIEIADVNEGLYSAMMSVASGTMRKGALTQVIRSLVR